MVELVVAGCAVVTVFVGWVTVFACWVTVVVTVVAGVAVCVRSAVAVGTVAVETAAFACSATVPEPPDPHEATVQARITPATSATEKAYALGTCVTLRPARCAAVTRSG